MLVNEVLVGLFCCYGNMICVLDCFLVCYEDIVKGCDFDVMCNVLFIGGIVIVLVVIFYLYFDMFVFVVVLFIFKNIWSW